MNVQKYSQSELLEVLENNIHETEYTNMFDKNLLAWIFAVKNEVDRERVKGMYLARAKELNLERECVNALKAMTKAEKRLSEEYKKENYIANNSLILDYSADGKPLSTIDNFLTVLENDFYFTGVKFNLLSYSPEIEENGITRRWTDSDDSKAKHYIEKKYKFHSESKYQDAFRILTSEREYHPVKQFIEQIEWDGETRIFDFLTKWAKCENSLYTNEVSRLIFAGGINRLYNPGCKFDDVPVLIGTKQGEGKSTLVRWLALKDDFFGQVADMDGQKGIEALEGLWICEIDEMLATTKAKEVEAVKSYITRQNDRYRRPFDRRVTDHPRQCIFIGTTNKDQFLTDKTGNRRFYPVKVNQTGYDLFNNEKLIKEDILQCWAEALVLFRQNKLKAYADIMLKEEIMQKQSEATQDDYREGLIEEYLESKIERGSYDVCCAELYEKALGNFTNTLTRKDSNELVLIMAKYSEWQKSGKRKRLPPYGAQLYWHYTG